MLFLTLAANDIDLLKKHIQNYENQVDGFEIRWDAGLDFDFLHEVRALSQKPMIFTYRTHHQGGFASSIDLGILRKLALGNPEYLDFEYDWPESWLHTLKAEFPKMQMMVSYHDFYGVPQNFPVIPKADIVKIAGFCHDAMDALNLLELLKQAQKPMIVIGMGQAGQWTRVMAKSLGSFITFACLPQIPMAPGQMDVVMMNEIYRYRQIDSDTNYFALIGDPIEQSIGHIYHNQFFQDQGMNARYLKIELRVSLLGAFLEKIKSWSFKGLSVTMPLKIKVKEYCKHSESWPSINTLYLKNNQWFGDNTDALGAWNALKAFPFQKVLILGAGGAGQALSCFFKKRNIHVDVYHSRNKEGQELLVGEDEWPTVDIIINTLPYLSDELLERFDALNRVVIMDLVYPKSQLETIAARNGLTFISGHKMFYEQAYLQQQIWQDHLL